MVVFSQSFNYSDVQKKKKVVIWQIAHTVILVSISRCSVEVVSTLNQ